MKKRAILYALPFFFAGIVISVLIGFVQRKTVRNFDESKPYLSLVESVNQYVLQTQLGLERIAAGDLQVNFENDILPHLSNAQTLLQTAYDGKVTELGDFSAYRSEEVRATIKEAAISVEKATALAQEKSKLLKSSLTDSTTVIAIRELNTRKVDAQLDQVLSSTKRLAEFINEETTATRSGLQLTIWISLGVLAAIFAGVGIIIYTQRDKTDRMESENEIRSKQQEKAVSSLSAFIEAISAGNFNQELQLDGENNLSSILLQMRDKLRENAENDRKRNWSTSGLAQIGEILRNTSTGINDLYDNILKFVVKYTKSNQGGLFLLNEENPADSHLELVACYAFERKKYLQKNVVLGEGLIGQCYLEGERIYLIEVPQEYITITSGLGGSNPNALLIVPLKVNEKIFGVLELATFGKFHDYEIELVEKLAETIASTISSVRINESTRILLEKTQQQAEEMRAQEEEMRQNMEELEATQEEMRRKEKHIEVMLETEKTRNEFNERGRQMIIDLSKSKVLLEGKWDAALEKITRTIGDHLHVSNVSIFSYHQVLNELICEKSYNYERKNYSSGLTLLGRDYSDFFNAVKGEKIISIKNAETHPDTRSLSNGYLIPNNIQSVLALPYLSEGKLAGIIMCEQQKETEWTDDFVEFLKSCADLVTVTKNTVRINSMVTNLSAAQETLQTIIDNLPRAVFWKDLDLRIQGCNRIFANVAGMKSHLEMLGKTDFEMPWKEHADAYRADDLQVVNSKLSRIDQEERIVNSEGKESWVLTSKVPVMNKEGQVVAVLGMFEDITERKLKEADVDMKLKELQRLKTLLENQKN